MPEGSLQAPLPKQQRRVQADLCLPCCPLAEREARYRRGLVRIDLREPQHHTDAGARNRELFRSSGGRGGGSPSALGSIPEHSGRQDSSWAP